MADARHLPHGRSRAGDRHLKFYETRDNLPNKLSVFEIAKKIKTRDAIHREPMRLIQTNGYANTTIE